MRFENCSDCGKYKYIEDEINNLCPECNEELPKGILKVEIDMIKTSDADRVTKLSTYLSDSDKFSLVSGSADLDLFIALTDRKLTIMPATTNMHQTTAFLNRFKTEEEAIKSAFLKAYERY